MPQNKLATESSPYLLQHAHNPVNWHPWSKEVFDKARKEDRLVLVSVGYSSCHWCHVMEEESFEDTEVAEIMNRNFITVKVDREERPDIDQLYMDAVMLMTGRGGWPMNVFTLPDGRPVFGGTYFPKEQWISICRQLAQTYKEQKERVLNYAGKLEKGIREINIINPPKETGPVNKELINNIFEGLQNQLDREQGGLAGAPKFPLPSHLRFLLHFHAQTKNKEAFRYINLTLENMAKGGIFDQIYGGFARYSTDTSWKVPHFEKMLYDNAQLVSVYSSAYRLTKKPLYREVVEKTLDFIRLEMTAPEGGFYSALDADTEGEEGRYYLWEEEEFDRILGSDARLFKAYFGINKEAYWKEGKNILLRTQTTRDLAGKFNKTEKAVREKISEGCRKLLKERKKRTLPGLDDKILTSWNGMMISGLIDAYKALGNKAYLQRAQKALDFLLNHLLKENQLYRSYKDSRLSIPAFLDDHAHLIKAMIQFYEVTFDHTWLKKAYDLAETTYEYFFDEHSGLFFYTSKKQDILITRKIETTDNVIPSPNSVMAENLFLLGKLFDQKNYGEISRAMLSRIKEHLLSQPGFHSNWAVLATYLSGPFLEIVISGKEALSRLKALNEKFEPNSILLGELSGKDTLPMLKDKFYKGKTLIYVCKNKTCKLPTENINEALNQIQNEKDLAGF